MREPKPIILALHEVRGILDGNKTQLRRVLTDQPEDRRIAGAACVDGFWCWQNGWDGSLIDRIHLPSDTGDILWVCEDHYLTDDGDNEYAVYAEDEAAKELHLQETRQMAKQYGLTSEWVAAHITLRNAVEMPRWASRLALEVSEVRIQRVQEITYEDTIAEGWQICPEISADPQVHRDAARDWFTDIWDSRHGVGEAHKHSWVNNPWIAAYTFTAHLQNVDDFLKARGA